jgi:uncharacterized membrane protein
VLLAIALVQTGRMIAGRARGLVRQPRRAVAVLGVPVLFLAGWASAAPVQAAPAPAAPAHAAPAHAALAESSAGQRFLSARPDAAALRALTGRPAQTPVRVYVPQDAEPTAAGRAALAVTELEHAGAFQRAAILIDLPTGSGWVNPEAVSALERLTGGNLATVVLQYAHSPSWLAYLRGGQGARASARALTDAVRARIEALPAGRRPRLLAYGESLGAWAGLRAYPDGGISRRLDGGLWVGVPGTLPVGHFPTAAHQIVLNHPDDPVPAWSPWLIVRPAPDHRRWLPFVTFWQNTADVISAERTPSGFGHRYGTELIDSWKSVLAT